jgi:imidazolonepropionase-like amidohydrolase
MEKMRMNKLSYYAVALLVWTVSGFAQQPAPAPPGPVFAVKAGRLVDPEAGTASANQTVLVQDGKITAVGANLTVPAGAQVIDLSRSTVLPGLVDAHTHLAMTMMPGRDLIAGAREVRWSIQNAIANDSTAYRAIEAAGNAFTMLQSGFTVVRDLGNNALYADTALRQAIEAGWVPGPTVVNSGLIIGAFGGQIHEPPEREELLYPEYVHADSDAEIIEAVHRNIHYGAKVIKVLVDESVDEAPYTVDQLKLFVAEAANAGRKVAGHVHSERAAMRAVEAGFWSIEHGGAVSDKVLQAMKEKGTWRVGTDVPFMPYHGSQAGFDRTVDRLKAAYRMGVKSVFSTDVVYYIPGMTRGEVVMNFLNTWKAADIPPKDILKAITTYGFQVSEVEKDRGPIKVGLAADMIAVDGDPLTDIDVLRKVTFVMKDGKVFKMNGVVSPSSFYK